MEIQKKYLAKYLHDLAVDQLFDEYKGKGYSVTREENVGNFKADLIARKGTEQILFEIKAGKLTAEKKEHMAALANYIRKIGGYKFFMVLANEPREKKLEIEDFKSLISNYIISVYKPEFKDIDSHAKPKEVIDVDIDEINISGNLIFIKGNGVLSLEIEFDAGIKPGKPNPDLATENFSFDFDVELTYDEHKKLMISKVNHLKIDVSSYYD